MLIKKLILRNNKRLMLNNIKEIVYEPTSPFQLILGTNGSGKSSMLNELSPLPAFSGDYTKEGSKTIELEDNNHFYILTSTFKNGNKHTFKRDDEILNDEGTAAVQKELVEKYFGYNQELHDVLIGDVVLTEMSPQKRREWFTKLSTNDLSYAIEVYNILKSRHRDSQGALSHVNKRLTSETNQLLSMTDIENIDDRVNNLQQAIMCLLENKDSQYQEPFILDKQMQDLLSQIEQLSISIIKNNLSKELKHFVSLSDIEQRKNTEMSEYQLLQQALLMKTQEYSEYEGLLNNIKNAGVSGIGELKEKRNKLLDQIIHLKKQKSVFVNISNIQFVFDNNEDVMRILQEILQQLPSNEEGYFSKDKIAENKQIREQCQNDISVLKAAKARAEDRYEHVKQAKDETCPKCQFIWKPGISEFELDSLMNKIQDAEMKLTRLTNDLSSANEYLEKAENYITVWRQFKSLVDNYPAFEVLWHYLLETELVSKSPKKACLVIFQWKDEVNLQYQISMVEEELKKINIAFEAASTIESISGVDSFQQKIDKLITSIDEYTFSVLEKQKQVDQYSKLFEDTKSLLLQYQKLESFLSELEKLFLDYVKGLKNSILTREINKLNISLGEIQHRLNEKNTLENLIKDLEKDSNQLDREVEIYKILIDTLSPINGIIAEQLYGNIQCIVTQMNEIIKQVWTYDMDILPCGLESNDLDYKFPIQIRSEDITVPDIGKGSTAQKEIVNFAFKLVVMLYLNKSEFPLHLDELGHSFDEQHRANIMNYVKLLIDSKRHSQLFYISHYASMSGSMANAEICVLDSTNISTPLTHNKHVTIR